MLTHHTLTTLRQLKLLGMADAYHQQLSEPELDSLSFEERFGLLVDREQTHRDNRRLSRLLKLAHCKYDASIEDIDYAPMRGLQRSVIASLAQNEWLRQHRNLLITGSTGCGKSYLACAFGNQACRQGYSVLYVRTPRLLEELQIAHGDGSYTRKLKHYAKIDLLILDDWGLQKLSRTAANDLLELIEDRHTARSTLITSQLPIEHWHDHLNDPTLADAILDRLIHGAHKLTLKGESMRKIKAKKDEKLDLS